MNISWSWNLHVCNAMADNIQTQTVCALLSLKMAGPFTIASRELPKVVEEQEQELLQNTSIDSCGS